MVSVVIQMAPQSRVFEGERQGRHLQAEPLCWEVRRRIYVTLGSLDMQESNALKLPV